MRPKTEPGLFHVGIVGRNFDPADLATDPAKFVAFIHENARPDLVVKNFTSLTYWKSVMSLVLLCRD